MVASYALLAEGLAAKIGILDLDMHPGGGMDEIVKRRRRGDRVVHYSFGLDAVERKGVVNPDEAEEWLRLELLDGGVMLAEQMQRRDLIVFRGCADHGLPAA